jgi:hypothetical protein
VGHTCESGGQNLSRLSVFEDDRGPEQMDERPHGKLVVRAAFQVVQQGRDQYARFLHAPEVSQTHGTRRRQHRDEKPRQARPSQACRPGILVECREPAAPDVRAPEVQRWCKESQHAEMLPAHRRA